MNEDTKEFLQVGNYRIEKGIPLPKSMNKSVTEALRAMKPGDSILISVDSRNAFNNAMRAIPGKISIRRVDEGHYRVFKVS